MKLRDAVRYFFIGAVAASLVGAVLAERNSFEQGVLITSFLLCGMVSAILQSTRR